MRNALVVGRRGIDIIDTTLSGMKFDVTLVSDAHTAIDLVGLSEWRSLFQLVISELQTDQSGLRVLQEIRRCFPEGATILVVERSCDGRLTSGKMPACVDAILFTPAEPGSIECVVKVAIAQAAERQRSVLAPSA